MNKKNQPSLHLEWTPLSVRALDVVSGVTAEAASVSELGPILEGHTLVLVGIGRRSVFLKSVRLPKAAYEDVRRIIGVQLGQWFPLPPDQLAFDFVQTDDLSPEGCLTLIAAIRCEDLQRLLTDLQTAGLTATRILPVALAAPAVAASTGRADALVLEEGSSGLALDIVQSGTLQFSRLVAPGSDPSVEARRTFAAALSGPLPVVTAGEMEFPQSVPGFGTALSLLHEAPEFSFRLIEDRSNASRKRANDRTRLAALMMVSALLLVALVWADRQGALAAQKRRDGVLTRQMTRLQSIQNAEADKTQKVTDAQDVLSRAFVPAQPLSDIVSVVGDSLPPQTWLTGLGLERGKPLQIRGTALSSTAVPSFVHALGHSPRFRDVRLVFANSVTLGKAKAVEFDISAVCVGNLPLSEPPKSDTGQATDTPSVSSLGDESGGGG